MGQFNDEHSGKGGSYVTSPDGARVLQERTGVVVEAAPVAEVKTENKSKVKGASNGKPN